MIRTKDTFIDIRIQAETSEELWESLPEEYKDRFKIKRVTVEKINGVEAKEVYKKCTTWQNLQKELSEVMKARTEREEQIRVENR